MKQFSMMETRWGRAAFGVLLFALLMLARDTLVTSCLVGFTKSQFLGLGLLCLFGLLFLAVNRKNWKQIFFDQRISVLGICSVLMLAPMLLKRDWQLMYFSILICIFAAVFFTYFTDVRQAARYYVLIFTVLCLHSLLTMYVLKKLAISGTLSVPVFYNANGGEFYNFGLSYVVTSGVWHRNFGIFREPGVYQFFILLALYLTNYKVDWKKSVQMWAVNAILALTMFSTFAVGGLIELALFAVFLFFDKKWHKTKWGKILGISAVLIVAAAVIYIVIQVRKPGSEGTVWYIFTDLYIRLFTRSDSLVDRLGAIFTNAQLFLHHPLVGETFANVLHGTRHNTSSTLILYAALGVLGGSLNVAAWTALAWEKGRSILGNLVLLVILFMSFNTQNLVADVFFWLFPFMALVEWLLPRMQFTGKKA